MEVAIQNLGQIRPVLDFSDFLDAILRVSPKPLTSTVSISEVYCYSDFIPAETCPGVLMEKAFKIHLFGATPLV